MHFSVYVIITTCMPSRACVSLVCLLVVSHETHAAVRVSVVVTADRGLRHRSAVFKPPPRYVHCIHVLLASEAPLSPSLVSRSVRRERLRACHQPQSLERAKCTAPFVLIDLLNRKKVEINTLHVCASCVKMCPLIHTTAGEPP